MGREEFIRFCDSFYQEFYRRCESCVCADFVTLYIHLQIHTLNDCVCFRSTDSNVFLSKSSCQMKPHNDRRERHMPSHWDAIYSPYFPKLKSTHFSLSYTTQPCHFIFVPHCPTLPLSFMSPFFAHASIWTTKDLSATQSASQHLREHSKGFVRAELDVCTKEKRIMSTTDLSALVLFQAAHAHFWQSGSPAHNRKHKNTRLDTRKHSVTCSIWPWNKGSS